MKTKKMPKEVKHSLDKHLHKKELQKMERALYKYRIQEIDFEEFIKKLHTIKEYYKNG